MTILFSKNYVINVSKLRVTTSTLFQMIFITFYQSVLKKIYHSFHKNIRQHNFFKDNKAPAY